jgi:hypothetical protein
MPYRVYKYAGKWHFKDYRGVRHTYDTERGARIGAGRWYVFYHKSLKKLHYDTGDDFGKTVYEEMYMNDEQASEALNESGKTCVLRWMMNWTSGSTGTAGVFDTIKQLNDGTDLDSEMDDGYSISGVLEAMGMKLIKMKDQWRVIRDADADSDSAANYNTALRVSDES